MDISDDKNTHRPNKNVFKLTWAQKLWKQNDFQCTQNTKQIMEKTCLNWIPKTKHENQRQEHEVCKTKIKM